MQCLVGISILYWWLFGCCHGQCEVLNQSNLTKIDLCHQLYKILEQALISNEANLYTLRETFFSTEHRSPSLIFICYHFQGNDIQKKVVVWSSSSLFKFINPLLFMASIPTIMLVAFFMVNVQTIPHQITLLLRIDANNTYPSLSTKEELDVLTTMTAKIKAYAVAQSKLSQWDGSNNGYTVPLTTIGIESVVFLVIPTIFFLLFAMLLLTFVAQMKRKRIKRIGFTRQYIFNVLHATGIIAAPIIVVEIYLCMVQLEKYATTTADIFKIVGVLKGIHLLLSLIVASCFACFGWRKAQTFPVNYFCVRLCCCFSHYPNLRQKLIHTFTLFNMSYLCFSLLISVCPTLLLVFVYPLEVITLLVTFGAFLLFSIKFLTSFISYNTNLKSLQQPHLEKVVRQSIFLFPLFALFILMCSHLKILGNTDYTGSSKLIQIGMSLLPSLILGVGYFSRNWLEFFHKEIIKEEELISNKKAAAESQKSQEKADHDRE